MPTVASNKPEKTLKGKEAEDRVINYLKEMNRPFGAVDISANIKGVVSKTATQKILVAAAERGEITQKTYGKTVFFVANQATLEEVPSEKIQELTSEVSTLTENNKELSTRSKALQQELAKIKATPSDADLVTSITDIRQQVHQNLQLLLPLRHGAPTVTTEELENMEKDWKKYRAEWIYRKKIFRELWTSFTEAMVPSEVDELTEALGIEFDSEEHVDLERLLGPGAMTSYRRA